MLHFVAEVGHFTVSLHEVLQLLLKYPGMYFPCQEIGRDFQGGTCFLSEVLCLREQAGFFQEHPLSSFARHFPSADLAQHTKASLAVASSLWSSSWPVARLFQRSHIQHGSVTERICLSVCVPITLCMRLSHLVVADH